MSKRFRTAYGWAGGGPDTEEQVRGKKAMKLLRSGDYMGTFHDAVASIKKEEEAKRSDKHKKIQAKVNKHLGAAAEVTKRIAEHTVARKAGAAQGGVTGGRGSGHAFGAMNSERAAHKTAAAKAKAQLPQGYAMVFGKLRKITAGKPRTGIAKLKR